MRLFTKLLITAAAAVTLSACVNSDLERAGVGAAVGAGTAAVLGTNLAVGAAVGGAAGALCDDAGVRACQ